MESNPETERLMWHRWQVEKDERAREWLIHRWSPLARSVAYRWPGVGREDKEDMAQEALLALIRCVDAWDPERTESFERFLAFRVRAAVVDWLRLRGFAKKSTRAYAQRLDQAEEDLTVKQDGRPPTDEELVEHLGLADVDELHQLRSQARGTHWQVISLDAMTRTEGGDGDLVGDRVADPVASTEGETDLRERLRVLISVLDRLPERERDILTARFLHGESQTSIARRYNLHESRISQVIVASLTRARRLAYERPLEVV